MPEKVIVSLIAVNQLLLAFLWLTIGVVYSPLLFLFGAWGMISAIVLFFPGFISRVAALAWHLLFVGSIFVTGVKRPAITQTDQILSWWAVIDLAAVFYLVKVIIRTVRHHSNSQTGDSLW
jgi:hypothetical protein